MRLWDAMRGQGSSSAAVAYGSRVDATQDGCPGEATRQATADADEKDNEYLLEDLLLQIALWGAQNKQFSPLHTTHLITCICHLAYVQLCTCTVHGSRRCTGEATGGSAPWRHRPEMIIFHAPRARRRAAPGATQMLRPDSEVAA